MTAVQKARQTVVSAQRAGRVAKIRRQANRNERRTVAIALRSGDWETAETYRVGDISRAIS